MPELTRFLLRIIWRAARCERILVFVGHQVFLVVWSWLVKLLLAEFDRSVNWYPIFSLRIIVINGFKYVLIWFGMVDCCILFALFVCHYCIHWIDVWVWVRVCSLLQTAKGITNRSTTLLLALATYPSSHLNSWLLDNNQPFGRLLRALPSLPTKQLVNLTAAMVTQERLLQQIRWIWWWTNRLWGVDERPPMKTLVWSLVEHSVYSQLIAMLDSCQPCFIHASFRQGSPSCRCLGVYAPLSPALHPPWRTLDWGVVINIWNIENWDKVGNEPKKNWDIEENNIEKLCTY